MSFFTTTEVNKMVVAATQGPFAIPGLYYPQGYDHRGSPMWVPDVVANALKDLCDVVDENRGTVSYDQLTVENFGDETIHASVYKGTNKFLKVMFHMADDDVSAFTQPRNVREQSGKVAFPFPFDYLFDQMADQIVDVSTTRYEEEGGVCFENTSEAVQFMAISLLNWLAVR